MPLSEDDFDIILNFLNFKLISEKHVEKIDWKVVKGNRNLTPEFHEHFKKFYALNKLSGIKD